MTSSTVFLTDVRWLSIVLFVTSMYMVWMYFYWVSAYVLAPQSIRISSSCPIRLLTSIAGPEHAILMSALCFSALYFLQEPYMFPYGEFSFPCNVPSSRQWCSHACSCALMPAILTSCACSEPCARGVLLHGLLRVYHSYCPSLSTVECQE